MSNTIANWSFDNHIENNSYINLEQQSFARRVYQVAVPLLLIQCVLSLLANAYILICIRWIRTSMNATLCFTVSLTVADGLVSLVMALSFIINSYLPVIKNVVIDHFMCFVLAFEGIRMAVMITAIMHLFALAINQYLGVLRPLHYSATMTPEVTVATIVILWLLPPVGLLLYFGIIPDQGFWSPNCLNLAFMGRVIFRGVLSLFFFIPLLMMLAIYAHIFVIISRSQQLECKTQQMRKTYKAITTTFLILGTFILGWFPAIFRFVLICSDCPIAFRERDITFEEYKLNLYMALGGHFLMLCKCIADPVIYAARVREIKMGLWLMHEYCCNLKNASFDVTETLQSTYKPERGSKKKKYANISEDGGMTLGRHLSMPATMYESRRHSPAYLYRQMGVGRSKSLAPRRSFNAGTERQSSHATTRVNCGQPLLLNGVLGVHTQLWPNLENGLADYGSTTV